MEPRVLLEKLTLPHLVNEFFPFHGTQRFISLQKSFPFVPILSLGLQSRLFPPNFFHQCPLCISLLPHVCHVPGHLNLLNFTTQIKSGDEYISGSCDFRHHPVTSYLSDPNILLSTLFSNTLSLCSFLSVRNKVPPIYNRQNYSYRGKHLAKGCPVYRSRGTQPKPTYIAIIRSVDKPTSVIATNNKGIKSLTTIHKTLKEKEY